MHSLNTLHESSPKKTCQQYQQLVVFLFLMYVATIHISISVERTVSLLSGLIHHKATLPDVISAYFLKSTFTNPDFDFSIIPVPIKGFYQKCGRLLVLFPSSKRAAILTFVPHLFNIYLYVVKSLNILCTAASSPTLRLIIFCAKNNMKNKQCISLLSHHKHSQSL